MCSSVQHAQYEIDYDNLTQNLKKWFNYPMELKSLKVTWYGRVNTFNHYPE